MSKHVSVMFSCNWPRNGSFRGTVDKIDICPTPGDIAAEIEGKTMRLRLDGKGSVVVSGHRFSIWSWREWVGNWCWDAATMDALTACQLLGFLRSKGWDLVGGYETLWTPFKTGQPLQPWMLDGEADEVNAICP